MTMKIIEATWEKRNLGYDAYEIELDRKDLRDFGAVCQEIRNRNFTNAYVVIKMPVGDLKALHALEDDGFRFMEAQLSLVDHFTPIESEAQQQNQIENVERVILPKQKEEWERVILKITPGMFDTDRISLDPKLGTEVSCKRYQNWCRDLFNKPNTQMSVMKVDGQEVCLSVESYDAEKNATDSILGGVFEEFKGCGYGVLMMYGHSQDTSIVKTAVSTNNLPVLKAHQHYGRVVYKEMYVLRKIYESGESK